MPSSSPFTINNFSPDFRDALLKRNLLADTVTNNSLSSWLDSINNISTIGNGVGTIKGSEDIEVDGVLYRESNVIFSKINKDEYYTGIGIDYSSVDVDYGIVSTGPINSPTTDGPYWRDTQNTIFNIFNSGNPEYYGNSVIDYKNTNITTNNSYIDNSLFSAKNNPEKAAFFRRDLSVTQNQYKADIYEKVSLDLLPFEVDLTLATLDLDPNTYSPSLEAYTSNSVPESGPFQGGDIRKFNTTKNMYLDVDKQTRTVIESKSSTIKHKSYLDEYGSIDFDVRSSLAGRLLTNSGTLNDTRLGQISSKYLNIAIGNNIAFNLQEETIGRVNTNPLSLAMGGSLIIPNNKITVASTLLGKGVGFLEKITGAKIPVSLLRKDADIFSYNTKGYIEIGNIERANAMLKNTGKGTVGYLFGNIKASINTNFLGNRQGYAPAFKKGIDEISDAKLYFLGNKGMVQNILSQSEENSPIPQSSHNLSGIINEYGFGAPGILDRDSKQKIPDDNSYSKFIWGDSKWNKVTKEKSPFSTRLITNSTDKKSLLHKTQALFNSGKIRTLISGKGKTVESFDNEITTSTKGFMSKGSAVLKNGGRDFNSETATANMFARAWSPVNSYNTYEDLQKYSALSPDGRVDKDLNIESSVLREGGVVQIGPYSDKENIKQFMFSLENLAWSDSLTKLLPCEIGPGDPLTGRSGRIMWFPPYDISINESVSASYDRSNFIGRGEPIYTYNNTERTGTLSWKIVVDHPNYLNFFKDKTTNEDYASFFAGAMSVKEIRNRVLSKEEKAKYEIAKNNKKQENGVPKQIKPKFEFNVFYPNDNSEVPYFDTNIIGSTGYESGRDDENNFIDYNAHPSGIVYDTVEIDGVINATTGFTKVYGMGTTPSDSGTGYTDNTNFGLNGTATSIKLSMSDIDELDGWYGFEELREGDKLETYFTSEEGSCRYCRFEITGYASPHGSPDYNNKLAEKRGAKLKKHIEDTLLIEPSRITVNTPVAIKESESGCKADSSTDAIECKKDRKVTIGISYDSKLEKETNPNPTKRDPNEPDPKFTIPLSRFYTECNYFESIKETDNFVYEQFKDKIKNFHPAFHAITPEGFNSRLTFLQQCMRQGPTQGENNPDNLAFGKAPVCILRLGDFYHTKIIIESLTIDYDPIVWDLNPEGIGVQPMIANVNISFAFIGGSSMKGPINRLQNAISFNYFANTELYDPRAERIKEGAEGQKGEILEGNFPFAKDVIERLEAEKKDQEEVALFTASVEAAEAAKIAKIKGEEEFLEKLKNDREILKAITIDSYKVTEALNSFALIIGINKNDKITDTGLQREYYGELFIKNSKTNENLSIGFITAKPINKTSFLMDSVSFTSGKEEDEATFEIGNNPLTIGFLEFSILNSIEGDENFFDDPKIKGSTKIINLLNPCGTFETVNSPESPVGPLASNVNTGFIPPLLTDIMPVFKPCKEGDNLLILKWTDKAGFNTSSKKVYNKANNKFSDN